MPRRFRAARRSRRHFPDAVAPGLLMAAQPPGGPRSRPCAPRRLRRPVPCCVRAPCRPPWHRRDATPRWCWARSVLSRGLLSFVVTWQWHLLGAFRLLPPVPLPRNAVTASRPAASSRHAVRTAPSSNLSFPQPRAHFHGRLGPGAGRPAGVTHHQLRPAQQQRAVHTQVGARASARVPAGRGCRGLRGADRGRALLPKDRQVGAVRPEGCGHQLRQERRHPHPARHRAVLLHADRRDADERCVAARSAPPPPGAARPSRTLTRSPSVCAAPHTCLPSLSVADLI